MAEHNALYQRAYYYDIALNRNVGREVDFIVAAYRYYTGRELQSVLDIACGPGYYARALAQRGLRAVGLDLQPGMIALAREKAAAEGLNIDWLTADMRAFQLSEPVDMALSMFDSLDALTSNEDLIHHFRTIAGNLTPGGLYLVDLSHPREVSYEHYGSFRYGGERDGIRVEITWGTNNPHYDLVTGVARTALEIRINDHGREQIIHDEANERLLYPQEIQLLSQLAGGLQAAGWHGDYDLNRSLDYSPAARRMIAVLQKMEGKSDG